MQTMNHKALPHEESECDNSKNESKWICGTQQSMLVEQPRDKILNTFQTQHHHR